MTAAPGAPYTRRRPDQFKPSSSKTDSYSVLAIIFALVAAALFAVGTVLMQKGTMEESEEEALKASFLLTLARKPVWLAGILADILGYGAQAAALAFGRLVVVQPLLVATVVFALPLGVKFTGQKIGRPEIIGATLVTVGLVVFTLLSDPAEGRDDAPWESWLIASAVFLVAAAVLVGAGRSRSPGVKAAFFGTAAGGLLGLASALTKTVVTQFDQGIVDVIADWHLYLLIAVSVIGFALLQAALATGSLAPAIATNMSVETVAAIVLGILLFEENLEESTGLLVLSLVGLLVALVGLVMLSRAEGRSHGPAAPAPQLPEPDPGPA